MRHCFQLPPSLFRLSNSLLRVGVVALLSFLGTSSLFASPVEEELPSKEAPQNPFPDLDLNGGGLFEPEGGLFAKEGEKRQLAIKRFQDAVELGESEKILASLTSLPRDLTPTLLATLFDLDRQWSQEDDAIKRQLSRAILVALARSSGDRGLSHLHKIFEQHPERRDEVAAVIARYTVRGRARPADWRLLVRALPILDLDQTNVVLRALLRFGQRGTNPQWVRQVILAGQRLPPEKAISAIQLLERWTDQQFEIPPDTEEPMQPWTEWFDRTYEAYPPATLPQDSDDNRYSTEELMKFLASKAGQSGDPERGAAVHERALCFKCHRVDERGEAMGPDLTTLAGRMQKRQIVESLLFPSQEIRDEYVTKKVLTLDGKVYAGVTETTPTGLAVLQADGTKIVVPKDDIDEVLPSRVSSMPSGLLNTLMLEEIADLFAFFQSQRRLTTAADR